mmetsp:Transcript_23166/g.53271  ORF Transcript_23166/g.53271 Transcript_23166/m.53271 type:complete len:258 (+) Transcript_23166:977-1750(+)
MSSFSSNALTSTGTPRVEHSFSKSSRGNASQTSKHFSMCSCSSLCIAASGMRPDCKYAASSSSSVMTSKKANCSTILQATARSPTRVAWKPWPSQSSMRFQPTNLLIKKDLCAAGSSLVSTSCSSAPAFATASLRSSGKSMLSQVTTHLYKSRASSSCKLTSRGKSSDSYHSMRSSLSMLSTFMWNSTTSMTSSMLLNLSAGMERALTSSRSLCRSFNAVTMAERVIPRCTSIPSFSQSFCSSCSGKFCHMKSCRNR